MNRKYIRRHKTGTWFLQRRGYVLFMIRELTAVFITLYAVMLLIFLAALGKGPEEFEALLKTLNTPGWMLWHAVVLAGTLWHAVTFFAATPQAMPVFIGEKRVAAPLLIFATGYAPWIGVSILIVWLMCP